MNEPDPFTGLEPDLESELIGESDKPKPRVDQLLASCGASALIEGSSIDAVVSVLRVLVNQIKGEDALLKAAVREAIIAKLQAIGIRSPAALVASAISLYAADSDQETIGLVEPMPWLEEVNGTDLLTDISSVFCRYVFLSSNSAAALALWTVLTYLVDTVWILPLLVITSPEKRCGKTLVLELLQACVLRPILASNISAASLYRVVEKYRPSLLIDEGDSFLGDNDELRGIINSGHRRSSAHVYRCDGDNLEPKAFSTWCPKAIASIGKLADTLEDRSIHIEMQRKTARDQVQRLRSDHIDTELEPLRRRAARWARDTATRLREADPPVPSELHDRAQDNWRPLLAIADAAGGIWPSIAREAAIALAGSTGNDNQSVREQLLSDVRSIFQDRNISRISSEDLAKALGEMIERPWPEWSKGRPITQRQIARLLKPFGIQPRLLRIEEKVSRGYDKDDNSFLDACSRYAGVVDPLQALQPNTGVGLSPIFDPLQKDKCNG
jgi:Protein of unknown function (DUF3631)